MNPRRGKKENSLVFSVHEKKIDKVAGNWGGGLEYDVRKGGPRHH